VLVTRDGIAKLIDFGVAKARDLASGNDISVCAGLKGKVRYMAPEQALDKTIDRRADLFSVGAIVYQLLTGRAPFEGPNELAIINALLSTNPVYVPDTLPEPVQWILRRALSRRPEQRFEDAAEMQNAIELALVELAQPDAHEAVAECLGWISGEVEEPTSALPHPGGDEDDDDGSEDETTAERRAMLDSGFLHDGAPAPSPPTTRPPSPPLAFAMPAAETVPARQSSLADDEPPLAHYPAAAAATASSFRFILLGAGFVGLLGVGAAMLVRDGPASDSHRASASETTAQVETPSPPVPAATEIVPSGVSTTTPIIELGDLDDGKPAATPRPRKRSSSASNSGAAPAPPPASKTGDLAGQIKVWK
jgi:serine/threonine-protein kinase